MQFSATSPTTKAKIRFSFVNMINQHRSLKRLHFWSTSGARCISRAEKWWARHQPTKPSLIRPSNEFMELLNIRVEGGIGEGGRGPFANVLPCCRLAALPAHASRVNGRARFSSAPTVAASALAMKFETKELFGLVFHYAEFKCPVNCDAKPITFPCRSPQFSSDQSSPGPRDINGNGDKE